MYYYFLLTDFQVNANTQNFDHTLLCSTYGAFKLKQRLPNSIRGYETERCFIKKVLVPFRSSKIEIDIV